MSYSKQTIDDSISVNSSYKLSPSTVKMLDELKCFIYDDPYIKYQDIVDAAIRFFYDYRKGSKCGGRHLLFWELWVYG
ncbi:hypothetical protein OW763_05785 [Clostridium aestuarii]|uniref:Uncharacterized protein n=1 Tax=Clostridium aestuarii TaxID=338193 RepID=A0ABT4CXX7_9CLOT|nr:hypothetical protein [Clostridium aestuarii]MCY6483859.1 hypothetical protein [Clostridium aestuarii]